MLMNAPAPAWLGELSPIIRNVTRLDADRAVVHLDLAGFSFRTIYVLGLADGFPRVSWPRTSRGYLIIEIPNCIARDHVEEAILAAVADASAEAPKPRCSKMRVAR
jgi:hypothetical protein